MEMGLGPSQGRRAAMTVALIVVFYLLVFAMAAGSRRGRCRDHGGRRHAPAASSPASFLSCLRVWCCGPCCRGAIVSSLRIEDHRRGRTGASLRIARSRRPPDRRCRRRSTSRSTFNAFVALRGGILGIGSRRVMGIGIPLLRTLRVDELRAVIAHEMGHFHAGDTKLGPWIHSLRMTLARAVINMGRLSDWAFINLVAIIVRAPLVWFLKLFLRVSQAVSRRQELAADALAVTVQGATAAIDGLTKTHAAGGRA